MKRINWKKALPVILTIALIAVLSASAAAMNDSLNDPVPTEEPRPTRALLPEASEVPASAAGMTRGAAAQMFAELFGLEDSGDLSAYTDIPADSPFADALGKCVAAGILSGIEESAMEPDAPVTKEMLYVMLARALGVEEAPEAAPTAVSRWARGAIGALISEGYIETGDLAGNGAELSESAASRLLKRVIALRDEKEAEAAALVLTDPLPDLTVSAASVTDYDNPDIPPYDSYEVTATAAPAGASYDVRVRIAMTALKPHRSRGAGVAYWTGFSVAAPEGAEGYRVAYSATGDSFGAPEAYNLTGDSFNRYFDAARWREYYVRLSWFGADFGETAPVVYQVDFTGVELDLGPLTAQGGPMGTVGVAGLSDLTEGADHRDTLFDSYGVELAHRWDAVNGGYFEITVRAVGLRTHLSLAGEGKWAGFSVAAPDAAGSARFSVYLSAESAKRNFTSKAAVPWDSFSANVDGDGSYGVRQLTNASVEDQRDYWAVLQWYSDRSGTAALTTPMVCHILLETAPAPAVTPQTQENDTGENEYVGYELD